MRLFGIPREAVEEAGRLDRLHADLRAEEERGKAERYAAIPEEDRKLRFGCLLKAMDLFKPAIWLIVFLHRAAPAFVPGLVAVMVAWPEAPRPVRILLRFTLLVCTAFSVPLLNASGVGRIDPFLALRLPSREALFLYRVGGLGTRVLLSGLGWAAAVAIRLLDADASAAAILPLALAAGLLPAAVVARRAWGKAPDPASEAVDAAGKIALASLAVLLTFGVPLLLAGDIREEISRWSARWIALLGWIGYGPVSLFNNGGFVLGHLRRSTMPGGAWARALRAIGSFLVLLAGLLGAVLLAADPAVVLRVLGGTAPLIGAATLLFLGALSLHLLRDGVRTFAAREVLPKGAENATRAGTAPNPAAATRPFPRKARSLVEARLPYFQEFPTVGEKVMVLVLLAGLGLFAAWCTHRPRDLVLLLAVLILIPWNTLEHRDRAWLLGMDLRDQRRHDRWMGFLWQGPLLLGIAAVAIPFAGGGADRWAILPWLLGLLVLRTGIAGWEAVLARAGLRSLPGRAPLYVLVLAVLLALLGGAAWSLGAAAAGIGIGLLGILLEERLLTESVLKEEMLRKAEEA